MCPRSVATAAVLTALLLGGAARAECPENALRCFGTGPLTTTSTNPSGTIACAGAGASYDLAQGSFGASSCAGDWGTHAGLVASDRYTVSGPPGPFEVVAVLRVRASASGGCLSLPFSGRGRARLARAGGSSVEAGAALGSCVFEPKLGCCQIVPAAADTDLRLVVAGVVGEPFQLDFEVESSTLNACARVSAELSFEGLGAGMSVESCQGFVVAPTSIPAASWGALKLRYR